jgi:hypothetical protein
MEEFSAMSATRLRPVWRAFHGRLNNPGHQWVEFRNEASDVPGKAFDGVIANVQPVASPVMILRYIEFAEGGRLVERGAIHNASMKALIAKPAGPAAGVS